MREPPSLGAGLDAWREWLDEVAPYGGVADPALPGPLRKYTREPLRDIAAVGAESWFRMLERDKQRRGQSAPRQVEFEDWRNR